MRVFFPFVVASLMFSISCGGSMTRYAARKVLLKVPELDISKKDLDLIDVTQVDSSHAVVKARIPVAFMLVHTKEGWHLDSIRLGDNKWEKVALLRSAIGDIRLIETFRRIILLSQGLLSYALEKNNYPKTMDIISLTDILYPKYLDYMVRTDAWGNELVYRKQKGMHFLITSLGPDGKLGTDDDIVFKDGHFLREKK